MKVSIIKKLSRNDLGLTGGHQAGICVPKTVIAKEFFPQLKAEQYNPRVVIPMYFEKDRVDVNFIFYNNRLHGNGTRCEYRLTGISRFLKNQNMKAGDDLIFSYDTQNQIYSLEIRHEEIERDEDFNEELPIVIYAGWSLQYKQ